MKSLFTLLSALLLSTSLFAEEGKHLFILTGQSNMAGMKPEAGFVPEAEKLFGEGKVAYIKVARGGQPIRLWVEEWDEIAEKGGLEAKNAGTKYYQPILDQFAKLIEENPKPASVTFCWMQGERDAKEKLDGIYEEALNKLVSNLRRDLKQPEMQIVIARLSDFGDGKNENWNKVREALVNVGTKDAKGAWVDCDDLNDKPAKGGKEGETRNDLHYTKEGYELLGRRYARQAKALVEGKDPAENGRPE